MHDNDKKNYKDLYNEAYKAFNIENYNMALTHFIKLKELKNDEVKFDIKIAECYFNMPYYTKANEKCDEIINNNLINKTERKEFINILKLKSKSLLKLKKINEGKILLENNKDFIKNNNPEFSLIEEEIKRKLKNMDGEYDYYEIYKSSKESLNIDIGEYINKKLEIKFESNKGICIFSKAQIKRGELLVVSKALSLDTENINKKTKESKNEKKEQKEFFRFVLNPYLDLEEIVSYKLSNYPEDYRDFFVLFDGKNKNMNLEERKRDKNITQSKIENVVKYNSKKLYFYEAPCNYKGLWFYPSLFNHSCLPNCLNFGFGDICIIIALNDIEPKTELNLSYFYGDKLFEDRQQFLENSYNFVCDCELCSYERKKFKEFNEKKILEEYLKKLDENIYADKESKNKSVLTQKEIENMVKFLEKNKKIFNCFEKTNLYLRCAICLQYIDGYLAYEYLERSLKYCENRNYYFEKLTLVKMVQVGNRIKSPGKIDYAYNKFRDLLNSYFPYQKSFVEMVIKTYVKI